MTPHDEFERTIFSGGQRPLDADLAPDTIGSYLVVLEGDGAGRRVEIGASPVTIGRDAQQTLAYADAELSRRHARVSLVGDEAVVEDMGSTNGTFLQGTRITQPQTLRHGDVVRVGGQILRYERRSVRDVQRAVELERDLLRASNYVHSLLPPSLATGPVLADWRFVPSAQLGGDAFGYDWLDPETFVFYLLDVSGHGVGSAMHSVTVLNVLRQRVLPKVDFGDPASVLASLNDRFQMDTHNGLYFTMWYGVYHTGNRVLRWGAAGHHPAYLVPSNRGEAQPLGSPALMLGVTRESAYQVEQTVVPPGTKLYLFSDGVFEIVTKDQMRWTRSDFLPFLLQPAVAGTSEAERIYQLIKQVAAPGPLEDDFSLLVLTFP